MSVENKQLLEETELYLQYGVDGSEIQGALELVHRYQSDGLVLRLLREYYSTLPEAREEAVIKVAELNHQQGVHLFVLVCTSHAYLYLASDEHLLLLGEYQTELSSEILSFFGYADQKAFRQAAVPLKELVEYSRKEPKEESPCPACGVAVGELHLVGCIVELCPWCDGQLSSCNCRFEKLETDEIEDEEQLETFLDMLTAKGRIPHSPAHSPAYPGTSRGFDKD